MSTRTLTFTGYDTLSDGVQIESETNPWVEVNGKPVNWTTSTLPRVNCPCDEDHAAIVPGVIDSMDTDEGIQRCDAADVFEGDLDAALALARVVNGTVKFSAVRAR